MFAPHPSRPRKTALPRCAVVLLGSLLVAFAASQAAHAVTYASIDGHPAPVTLTVGETVIVRLDVGKAGGGINFRIARDVAGSGKYDAMMPIFANGAWTDGQGDNDPTPGKMAIPYFVQPDRAAGSYILRLEDVTDGSSFELPGISIVPKPEAQAISGRVMVTTPGDPAGTPPPDAVVWAYADSRTPVASAAIKRDGSYSLPVPPGTYILFAEWLGNLHSLRQVTNVVAGQQRTGVDLPLLQGQEVAGIVRSGGQPAADAVIQAVSASGAMMTTRTLADGSYVLVLPSGQHRITAVGITQEVTVADGPVDGVDFPPPAAPSTLGPGMITTVAGNGTAGFGGDGRPAINARLLSPQSLVFDKAGNLYISTNAPARVRKVDATTGVIATVAGSSPFDVVRGLVPGIGVQGGYGGDGGPATRALLWNPQNVTVDANGNLYISETFNHRVRKVDPNGIITTVVGTGKEGFAGDGGPANQAQIAGPQAIVFDKSGNLYVADGRNRRVRKVDPSGIITIVLGGGTEAVKDGIMGTAVALPGISSALAVDKEGNLYVGGGPLNRILKLAPTGIVSIVAGNGTAGFSGDGGPAAQAQFNATFPRMGIDSAGNLFFADSANHRIRKVSPEGIITTVVGSGPIFPEPGSFAGDGGPATAARLWSPNNVAIDAAGNLYFSEGLNHRVRKVIGIAAPGLIAGQ